MKIDYLTSLEQINSYLAFIPSLNLENEHKRIGAVRLQVMLKNLDFLHQKEPAVAESFALHKLETLLEFEKNCLYSSDLLGDFQETFYGSWNIGLVDGRNIFRNSQPSQKDLQWFIQAIGVKTVINLRREREYWTGFHKKDEEKICHFYKAKYINFRLDHIENPPPCCPSKQEIEEVLESIASSPKPILLHCSGGVVRAGMVTAAYKLTQQKAKFEEVLQEAVRFGFYAEERPNQVSVLRQFKLKA